MPTLLVPPPDPSSSRRRRRGQKRPPTPPSATSKVKGKKAIPHTRRHYSIPPLLSANNNPGGIPAVGSYPFPATIPALTPSRTTITHASQDDVVEETWGPITSTEDVPDKKDKPANKDKGKKKQNGEKRGKLKMCATNGFQPRRGEEEGEGGKKVEKKLSGSTEQITTYMVEKMADGGKRKTWVTWSRIVTVLEEEGKGGDGEDEESDSESEDSEESGEEGKAKSEAESESSDEEYFDEKRSEWRSKSEPKQRGGT